jgi:type IV secretion system protein VirB9
MIKRLFIARILKTSLLIAISIALLSGCQTVHFDEISAEKEKAVEGIDSYDEEIQADRKKLEQYAIEEELKEVDVEQTIIYIDRPVYSPEEEREEMVTGTEAVKQSTSAASQIPMKYVNGKMYYPWDESFVYEVHCQPYRVTDIQLEPGEQVLEMPFLSEEKVWEIGAGVSKKNGLDVQHFFAKPTYSGLVTSMIIITDRRVYHILLKSFKDNFMVMVQWEYPQAMPFTVKSTAMNNRMNELRQDTVLVDPAFLSFDYKMTYSIFRKPIWLPKRVYDDGRKTYIELDEKMLHMESPVLFNHRNERINYRVQKNLIIIDELIDTVTLRRGKEKVTVKKKKYSPDGYSDKTEDEDSDLSGTTGESNE